MDRIVGAQWRGDILSVVYRAFEISRQILIGDKCHRLVDFPWHPDEMNFVAIRLISMGEPLWFEGDIGSVIW